MRAVGVVPGRREVQLLDHVTPHLTEDHHVRVKSLEVGICGTDKEICTFVYGSPPPGFEYLVLGHESLGEVVEVGADVTSLKVGDLVVPSVRRPCPHAHCQSCQDDLQDFCATGDFTERGIKMTHGFMTEYYVDEEKYLHPVPAGLRDVAVLAEPLTIVEKAMQQVWLVQQRLPWKKKGATAEQPGRGLNAVVLGAGPVGILGAMVLVQQGFKTWVYSRSRKPNPKADLVESFGATYVSAETTSVAALAEMVGNIDLVYEAVGVSRISFDVLKALALNGVFVFTGIPAPKPPMPIEADNLMRDLVLKNQMVLGTVNADRAAFESAIRDLGVFKERWPGAIGSVITGRHRLDDYRDLLVGDKSGIKSVIALD